MNDKELMEKVVKGWRSNETPCGAGSELENTKNVRKSLWLIIKKYKIKTVVDAGAGDLNWIKHMKWNVEYQGYDLYPRHESVIQFDLTKEILPKSDLILCRHVLNHLSPDYAQKCIDNFSKSGSKYLAVTNCDKQREMWQITGLELIETWLDFDHKRNNWCLEFYKL
tara:strand:- start:1695 stop:2195 length:501 start_codon:yes stop_codon:yes gene_type:complete